MQCLVQYFLFFVSFVLSICVMCSIFVLHTILLLSLVSICYFCIPQHIADLCSTELNLTDCCSGNCK